MSKFKAGAVICIWLIGLFGVTYGAAYISSKYAGLTYLKLTAKVTAKMIEACGV